MAGSQSRQSLKKSKNFVFNKKNLLGAIASVAIALISAFFIYQNFSLQLKPYQQSQRAIVALQELDKNFDLTIFKSRYQLFPAYDLLVQNLSQQQEIRLKLQALSHQIDRKERTEIKQLLDKRAKLLQQKEKSSERFKSQNALLKNSLRYLPLLINQIERNFDAQVQSETLTPDRVVVLRSTLNQLIHNLLLYNVSTSDSLKTKTEALIKKLAQLEVEYELTEDEFPSQLVRSHAKIIVNTKPQVEQLSNFLLLSLEENTNALEQVVRQGYVRLERQRNRYRFASAIWFLLLLAFGNFWAIGKLREANPKLARYKQKIQQISAALQALLETQRRDRAVQSERTLADLSALANRNDEIGQLASTVGQMVEQSQPEDEFLEEEYFSFLSVRLRLLTKNQSRLFEPEIITGLETLFKQILDEQKCNLLEFRGQPEQVEMVLNYPPQMQLSQLVAHLKTESLDYIKREFATEIEKHGQIWSNSYWIATCDGVPDKIDSVILPSV